MSIWQDISASTGAIFTKFSCMLPMAVSRSSSGRVTKSQGEGGILGLFLPIDNHCNAFVANNVMHQQNGPLCRCREWWECTARAKCYLRLPCLVFGNQLHASLCQSHHRLPVSDSRLPIRMSHHLPLFTHHSTLVIHNSIILSFLA